MAAPVLLGTTQFNEDNNLEGTVFHYRCDRHLVTEGCTTVRVNLNVDNQYCWMCQQTQDPAIPSRNQETKECKKLTLGCVKCKEPICEECRAKGYDEHQQKKDK